MKKISSLLFSLILLAGCGEIEVAEEIPSVADNAISVEVDNSNNSPEDADGEVDSLASDSAEGCTSIELTTCENKAEACISDLQAANMRVKNLEETVAKLQNKAKSVSQTGKFNDFFIEYFKNVPQTEFAFNSCGRITAFTSKPWFADFQATLADRSILFKLDNRPIEAGDFFGGCTSTVGNIAFFLGAGFNNQTEFHLVKFNLETKELVEATVAKGSCTDCPNDFGKRKGPFIELFGNSGTSFRYYFDKNVLIESSYFN